MLMVETLKNIKAWTQQQKSSTFLPIWTISVTFRYIFSFYEKCYIMVRYEEKLFLENFLF